MDNTQERLRNEDGEFTPGMAEAIKQLVAALGLEDPNDMESETRTNEREDMEDISVTLTNGTVVSNWDIRFTMEEGSTKGVASVLLRRSSIETVKTTSDKLVALLSNNLQDAITETLNN